MEKLVILLVVVAIGAIAVRQIIHNPKITRGFALKSLGWLVGLYLFGGIGLAITLWIADGPQPQDRAAALTVFAVAWILFGGLWLTRFAPRLQEPPAWLMRHWGIPDFILILLAGGALGYGLLI